MYDIGETKMYLNQQTSCGAYETFYFYEVHEDMMIRHENNRHTRNLLIYVM